MTKRTRHSKKYASASPVKQEMNPANISVAVKLYNFGISLNNVARTFGVSREWARLHIVMHEDAIMRPPGRTKKGAPRLQIPNDEELKRGIILLYYSGLTLPKLADALNVAPMILRDQLDDWEVVLRQHTARRDPDAIKMVNAEVQAGRLVPQPCERCGFFGFHADGRRAVIAHHDDYNKPLNVRWLCALHHREWHSKNTPIMKGEGTNDAASITATGTFETDQASGHSPVDNA